MHILLKQNISRSQINAAEAMIDTFHKLLPELYGDESCTANAHNLSHLTKYVRLWGPLWTHSAFGFESMNGHLTNMFHSRTQIHDQLIFSVQVNQALQHLSTFLTDNEDEKTLKFLSYCQNSLPRKNMLQIAPHVYMVGTLHYSNLTDEEHRAISLLSLGSVGSKVESFSRMFCNGVLYHTTSYKREGGKRNSSVCCYHDGSLKFGEIQRFCRTTKTFAIIKSMAASPSSLLKRCGISGRHVLQQFADADLLGSFVFEVFPPDTVVAVPIEQLQGVCVYMQMQNRPINYVTLQPNHFEHL
jgi:hypothetical protein